jgi:hypothetical protein
MAGSFTDLAENAILDLIFDNVDWANIGDSTGLQGSGVDGSLYISLHQNACTDALAGTECSYTGYAREAVSRTNGWTIAGNNASNTAAITFGENTGTSQTATHMAIYTALTGGDYIAWADLSSSITIDNGTIPEIPAGDLDVNMD